MPTKAKDKNGKMSYPFFPDSSAAVSENRFQGVPSGKGAVTVTASPLDGWRNVIRWD